MRVWRIGVAVAAACGLVGCGADSDPAPTAVPSSSAAPTGASSGAATPTAKAVRVERSVLGVPTVLEVGPAYRTDGGTLLPVRVTPEKGAPETSLQASWSGGSSLGDTSGFTLVDFEAGTAQPGAQSSPVFSSFGGEKGELETFAFFGQTTKDTVDVLVPLTGMVYDVPVVDGPAPQSAKDFLASVDQGTVVKEPLPLTEYRERVDGAFDVAASAEEVEVNLAADVLFAVDSAELSGEADGVLQDAAAQLRAFEGGQVEIVGHTDSVADDAHNLELSRRRAEAVRQRLDALGALQGFEVTVDGRGESEPRVEETDDESRQLNRRVELRVTGKRREEAVAASAVPTPAAGAVTGQGTDTLRVPADVSNEELAVRVVSLERRGKFLVGQLEVSCEQCTSGFAWKAFGRVLASAPHRDNQPEGPYTPATQLALLAGDERVFPVEFEFAKGRLVLTDPNLYRNGAENGKSVYTVTAVWPDLGGDKVTIDVNGERADSEGWRISDVPIAQ